MISSMRCWAASRGFLLVVIASLSIASVARGQTTRRAATTRTARAAATAPAFPNHVHNPSFESGIEGWGLNINAAQGTGDVDSSQHHTGSKSFKITFASKFAPNVYLRLVQGVGGLKPNTAYHISGWSKGKGAGMATIGGGPGWFYRVNLPKGDYDWTKTDGWYLTGANETGFELMFIVESPTTALWLDDVSFVEDPSKTNEMKEKVAAAQRERQEKLRTHPKELLARYESLKSQLDRNPKLATDPYIQLGLSISKRFLDRVQMPGIEKKQSDEWSLLQIEEVETVLNDTEKLISAGTQSLTSQAPIPWPSGRPTLRDGIFYTNPNDGAPSRPWFFDGYGHFDQVVRDLPNFQSMGASLVQDGRAGPSSMNEDGSLRQTAQNVIDGVHTAERNHMKVDFLVSPHYYPEWATKQTPDANWIAIDNPKTREVHRQWMEKMASALKDSNGLLSFCLTNEPTYQDAGRDKYSRPFWTAYLRKKYSSIATLNEMYGTKHNSFEDVAPPNFGWPSEVKAQRAYFDWVRFDQQHWADFHHWMHTVLKSKAPNVPTHAKIMVFFALDQDKVHYGVDPELFCDATDIAGCDNYANLTGGEYAYEWRTNEILYDLLHSFRNQPVFNSENHIIPDGSPPNHIPPAHTRAALWQQGLHHQGATTIWVWEENMDPALAGSIYFRPANIYSAGRAMLDLNRLGEEVAAIDHARPRIAMLYSMPSVIWDGAYKGTIWNVYTALNFMGEATTFVSEKQLAERKAPPVQWIIVPAASHVADQTVVALHEFVARGGHVIFAGDNDLRWNEYHIEREIPQDLRKAPHLKLSSEEAGTAKDLLAIFKQDGLTPTRLDDAATHQPAWGVEYRVVPSNGSRLIPLMNLTTENKVVQLPAIGGNATDLLSGATVDLNHIALASMQPMLLRVRGE